MSHLAPFLNTILTLVLFAIASLAMVGSLWAIVLLLCREGSRPPVPSDDVSGDVPNLPEGFLFHGKDSAR